MKDLINFISRFLIKVALNGYFHRIKVIGKENIPKGKPIILVSNHQNALIDPLLLATNTRLNPYFLTRASVFENSFTAKILNYIRMLPVYRVRDGFATLQQNQITFDQTYEVLRKNGTVIIFAEGSHSHVRNVRPLSKGFTRMAFGLKEKYPECEPVILPVGFDYSAHMKSGSKVQISFGKPIPVDMPNSQSGKLTKLVEKALKDITVDIPDEGYKESLQSILENNGDITSKKEVNEFLATGKVSNPVPEITGLTNKLMKIFHFPLYCLWLLKKPSVKDPVFSATWKFLIGMTLALGWYFILLWMAIDTPVGSWALTFLILAWITLWNNKNPQE